MGFARWFSGSFGHRGIVLQQPLGAGAKYRLQNWAPLQPIRRRILKRY